MVYQSIPNTAQFTVHMLCDAQSIQQSMYFRNPAGWTVGGLAEVAEELATQWDASMMALYTASVSALFVVGVDLESLTGGRAIFTYPTAVVGDAAGDATPNNVALAIQLSTGNRGRGQQGRMFIGPLPDASVVGNVVAQAHADAIVLAIGSIAAAIEELGAAGLEHVIVHRKGGTTTPTLGTTSDVQSILYTNRYVDSQKLRLPFHKKRRITVP